MSRGGPPVKRERGYVCLFSEFCDGLVQGRHGDGFDDAGPRDAAGIFVVVSRPDPAVAVFCGADDGQGFVV